MSAQDFQVRSSESKPVRVLGAVGAGLLAVVSGLAAIPGVPGWVPAVVGVAGLGITVGVTKFTEDKTVPWSETGAKKDPVTGELVAGPAADVRTGAVVTVEPGLGATSTPPPAGPDYPAH